ncbi:striated muscle-specific serine/threonine-protein kinase-like [Myotis lucifugus]|uniref:striated muscle-specific serine/threonine-protein kinase-like n=1 Tax=Myotis lucifugus TaxID=59463 RepID=UPI000CCC08F1|nr:striated muscle-specific serine/threonine-protein kinase-like [Myotis lucifugus]
MQKSRGLRGEEAGTRAPPSPGVPPKRAKVGAGGGAGAGGGLVAGAPVFLRPLKDAAVFVGCDVRLRVVVSGAPQPSLSWFRDGQLLPSPAPEPSCLWLRNCGQQDAGKYSCRAQNERGQACCEAVVTVLEVGGNGEGGAGSTLPTLLQSSVTSSLEFPEAKHEAEKAKLGPCQHGAPSHEEPCPVYDLGALTSAVACSILGHQRVGYRLAQVRVRMFVE